MAPGSKTKTKNNNLYVCFINCKIHRLCNKEMVQCHICQTLAPHMCIDEE